MSKFFIRMAVVIAAAGLVLAGCEGLNNLGITDIPVTSVRVTPDRLTLAVGVTKKLEAAVSPGDATDKAITWGSSNTDVATVTDAGVVEAKAGGAATITATAKDGSGYFDTCIVTVIQGTGGKLVSSITLTPSTLSLEALKTEQLTWTIVPENADNHALEWVSDNNSVAIVNDGLVTAVSQGTATITAVAADGSGITASCFVTVSAPSSVNVQEYLDAGIAHLKNANWDAAIQSFETAYSADKNNPKAVVYSSLAKLTTILVDPSVRTLMANKLGVRNYPTTIGDLVTNGWLEEYVETHHSYWDGQYEYEWWDSGPNGEGWYRWDYSNWNYQAVFMSSKWGWAVEQGLADSFSAPGMDAVPSWMGNSDIYKDSLVAVGSRTLLSDESLMLVVLANLLEKNTSGLNDLLDGVINSVFGPGFTAVESRISGLGWDYYAPLSQEEIETFGLGELFEGDGIYIGRAEITVLMSALKLVKASLEWLSSYDWNTDLSFAKADWSTQDALMANLKALNVNNLPLRNNFLKARSDAQAKITAAKTDYSSAIDGLLGSWDSIAGRDDIPDAVQDYLNAYGWIKTGLTQLKDAIDGSRTFWIPEIKDPEGFTWPTGLTEAGAVFGIDWGKFFTPGYLSLDKFIKREPSSANTPEFYVWIEAWDQGSWSYTTNAYKIVTNNPGTGEIRYSEAFNPLSNDGWSWYGIKTDFSILKTIVPGLLGEGDDMSGVIEFPREIMEILFYKYNGLILP